MTKESKIVGLSIGLLCSMAVSCSLVFDSDEYLAKDSDVDRDGGSGSGGSGGAEDRDSGGEDDGGESGNGGRNDATAGNGGRDSGDSGVRDTGAGGAEDTGTPPPPVACDEETDCNELLGTGWASICVDGVCVNCDRDNDGWIAPIRGCDELVEPSDLRDCDDNDDERYPHAPALCGDGKVNSCDVVLTEEAQTRFQVAEIGFIGLTIISSVHDNIDIDEDYPADFTRASQLSITGQQVGEVGVNSQMVSVLTFMDSEGSADQSDQANTARLLTISTWYDGWPDVDFMDEYNLNQFVGAEGALSVDIRHLQKDNSILAAMIGYNEANGTTGSTLFYTRVVPTGGDQYGPTDPQRVPMQNTDLCDSSFLPAEISIIPRLAITGQTADGLARAIWFRNGSTTLLPPSIISHLYSPSLSSRANPVSCKSLGDIPRDTKYIELQGSSGPFVVGGAAGQAFSWEGTESSPADPLAIPTNNRPSVAFFEGADYLASVAGPGGYSVSNLVCQPDGAASCTVEHTKNIPLPVDTNLAAMDNLGTTAAVLGLVETAGIQGSSDRADEVVIRILGRDGEILPVGGVQYQIDPGSLGAEPQPLPTSSLFPVFRLEPSDDPDSTFRVVDLAVSSWFEESSSASEYPLTILVAAIVSTEPQDVSLSDRQPASGNLIVLSGIRGCREL